MDAGPLPAAAAPRSSGGGLLGKIANFVGGAKQSVPPSPAPPPSPSAGESETLRSLGEAVRKTLERMAKTARDGTVPRSDPLEADRQALLRFLKTASMASEVAALQHFLRQEAVELVAAVRMPGATAAALLPVLERQTADLGAILTQTGGKFWESSV